MSPTRDSVTPWFFAALLAQALLLVLDVVADETFTAVYVLPPLALALVERPRPVGVAAALAVVLAVASGIWNDDFWEWGHGLRCAIVVVGSTLAVLSAQARSALYRSQSQAVAARKRAEATGRRLDAMLGSLAEAVTVHDESGKTVYANDAAVKLLGATSLDEILTAEPGDLARRFLITGEDGSPVETGDFPGRKVVAGEPGKPMLTRSVRRDTGESYWLLTKATVVNDEHGRPLAVNVIEDVTEAKEAELRQRFLARATQVLSSSLDYDVTLERVAWLAVPTFADWCAVDIFEGGAVERVALAHVDPEKLTVGQILGAEYPPDMDSDTGLGGVIRSGRPEMYPEITDEMLDAGIQDPRHRELIATIGMRSAMIVPMKAGAATIGALTFVNADSARSFDEDDLALAEDLAARAGTAVENARLYTRLAQTAETLQASLLPARLEQPPGWRIAASYKAGEHGTEVGGDFYDIFAVDEGWMVVLGDVTGKGVKAAALTALARHTAKTAARFDSRPASVMSHVNEVLREQPELSIVTVVCALLRPSGPGIEVAVVSAGHPLPLRVSADGSVAPVGRHDVVLGAVDDGSWEASVVGIAPGDTLFFYTDGVTDTLGADERYGEERLLATASAGPSGAEDLIRRLERDLEEFEASDRSDDRAMLALEWVGVTEPARV
jgi:serine phosphatase RsbU (regulator of sigma subunit)/PAS domain-containing protein